MSVIETTKLVGELIKKGATLELQEAVMRLREEALELQEDNLSLKQKVRELEEMLNQQEEYFYESPAYWKNVGDTKEGPFCQSCFENSHKVIRLQRVSQGHWKCKVCSNDFYDGTYKPPAPITFL